MGKNTKLVTVVIPAYNEEKTIASCIKSVLSQNYRPLEAVVIDDGSRDGTARVARDFRGVRVISHKKNEGLAASLNDGMKISKGDLVMVLHADCELVGRDWIKKATAHFSGNERTAVVSGKSDFSHEGSGFIDRVFMILRLQVFSGKKDGIEEIPFFEDKCDVYRKSTISEIGGFASSGFKVPGRGSRGVSMYPTRLVSDKNFRGEDQVVSYLLRKAGYRIMRDNSLRFIQRHGQAASTFFKNIEKEYVYGRSQGGITACFGLFQLKGGGESGQMKTRIRYRLSKVLFALLFPLLIAARLPVAALGLLVLRYFNFLWLIGKTRAIRLDLAESLILPLIGILTDFVYALGFGAGLSSYLIQQLR